MGIEFDTYKGVKAARFSTDNSASMLFRHTDIPLAEFPMLNWQWLIETQISSAVDETTGEGDDSAARLFISFDIQGEEPRRMELIWARQLKAGQIKTTHGFNHYVVRGADDALGEWQNESVNLQDIYAMFWSDEKPAVVKYIAFFCDSDDTGEKTVSYFSGLSMARL